MLNQKGGSKTDTLVKLVLILFISLLSFSIGTFVGKQFSDTQYKLAMETDAGGSEMDQERDIASAEGEHFEMEPSDALTEEDRNSLEAELMQAKATEGQELDTTGGHQASETTKIAKVTEKNETGTHIIAKETLKRVESAATRIAQGQSPTRQVASVGMANTAKLPLRASADSIGKYTVQVSSHSNEKDALEHAKSLQEKGYGAFYTSADVKGKTWYRVNVGLFGSQTEANESRKKIIGTDIKNGYVAKIVQ